MTVPPPIVAVGPWKNCQPSPVIPAQRDNVIGSVTGFVVDCYMASVYFDVVMLLLRIVGYVMSSAVRFLFHPFM